MLINQVAIYPNATVQLDSVNLLVLSKVVRRSCRRDSTQQCQHYHSINFMKYFTCKKKNLPLARHSGVHTISWVRCVPAPCGTKSMRTLPKGPMMLAYGVLSCAHGDVWLNVKTKHPCTDDLYFPGDTQKLWMKHLKYGGHLGFQDVSNRYRWHAWLQQGCCVVISFFC